MSLPNHRQVHRVLILKSDRFCAAVLRQAAVDTFPDAKVAVAGCIADARKLLRAAPCHLLVTGIALSDGGLFDLLDTCEWARGPTCRVLVVTPNPREHVVRLLRALSVAGVFDTTTEDPEDVSFAMLNASLGLPCVSAAVAEHWAAAARTPARRPSRANGHATATPASARLVRSA